jgi:ADP-ribose pyrophosphatase YjhB (NUDIX family)
MKQKQLLVGSAIVYRRIKDKPVWFLVKQKEDSDWEIPKTNVRRGESSVRAVIRMMGEQAAMNVKVIEEVGRKAGAALIGGNTIPQRTLYYLMYCREAKEVLAFAQTIWLEYPKAVKQLKDKKEQAMLKKAKDLLKELDRKKKTKK